MPPLIPKSSGCQEYAYQIWLTHSQYFLRKSDEKELKPRPTHQRTDANLYPPERQLTKASEPSFDLGGGAKGQI